MQPEAESNKQRRAASFPEDSESISGNLTAGKLIAPAGSQRVLRDVGQLPNDQQRDSEGRSVVWSKVSGGNVFPHPHLYRPLTPKQSQSYQKPCEAQRDSRKAQRDEEKRL